jgi:hypothetical protein
MLQRDEADDFGIAASKAHRLIELVERVLETNTSADLRQSIVL